MIGSTLGPYRIDGELGSGGMGMVYRATGPEGLVALKVVHAHLVDSHDAIERFRREVEIGQTVEHPNVVRTFGGGEADGRYYMAMEYVEGQTLDALLLELERVPEQLCRHIGREVSKGLAAIHAIGAIHRDIKPENIIVACSAQRARDEIVEPSRRADRTELTARRRSPKTVVGKSVEPPQYSYVVKLMDLGVARPMDDAHRLSQSGLFVGSLRYASPEQFQRGGKDLDGRSDLHALGIVLYELASGAAPFTGEDASEVIRSVLEDDPRRLGEVNPQLSPYFEEVVHTLLRKKRDERLASANALRVVLEDGEEGAWWRDRARVLRVETRRPLRRIRIPRETAVYGRDSELAALEQRFKDARAGRGRVILLRGEAGVGKSRLVDELVGRLQQQGEDFDFLFGSYPPGGAATVTGAFSTAYREFCGAAGSAPYLPENRALVPAFDALLRGESTPKGEVALTKDSLQTCFVRTTQSLTGERTVVVLIDDLHFAPEEGRALFASLALSVPGQRLLLIGTLRPGVAEDWVAGVTRSEHAEQLLVPRLGPKDLVRLLEDSLRSPRLAAELGVRIALKSDGNPFFVFEIVRSLREAQLLTQNADGSWATTRVIDEIEIPSSVLDLVNARVASLSEDERNLLDVAACCGYEFDPLALGKVLGIARIPLLRQLAQIERRHRLVRSAGVNYVFDHHQVQEALYASLPELLRREYHAAVADVLAQRNLDQGLSPDGVQDESAVTLAEHYLNGGRATDALEYLDAALDHLESGSLRHRVVEFAERALAVPQLLVGRRRARLLLRTAVQNAFLSRWDAQRVALDAAREIAAAEEDVEFCGELDNQLGGHFIRVGNPGDARAFLERALGTARELGHRGLEAVALGNLSLVLSAQGDLTTALEYGERVLAIHHEIDDTKGIRTSTGNLGNAYFRLGRFAEARESLELVQELCRESGDRGSAVRSLGNLAGVCLSEGRLVEAEAHYRRQVDLARELGDRLAECFGLGNLGNLLDLEGRHAEVAEQYEAQLRISREIAYAPGEAVALTGLGVASLTAGDLAAAEVWLHAALEVASSIGLRHPQALARLGLGEALLERADEDGARAQFEIVDALASPAGFADLLVSARCRLALLPGGDAETALASFIEYEDRLSAAVRRTARWLLFRATGDSAHLVEARRLLDAAVADLPAAHRAAMLENVRVHRDILAACAE